MLPTDKFEFIVIEMNYEVCMYCLSRIGSLCFPTIRFSKEFVEVLNVCVLYKFVYVLFFLLSFFGFYL